MKRHLSLSATERVLSAFVKIGTFALIARTLGPSGQGAYALLLALSVLGANVALLGTPIATTRMVAGRSTERASVGGLLGNALGLAVVTGGVAAGAIAWASVTLDPGEAWRLIPTNLLVLSVVLTTLQVAVEYVVFGLMDFARHLVGTMVRQGLFIVTLAVAWALGELTISTMLAMWNVALAASTGYWMWRAFSATGHRMWIDLGLLREQVTAGFGAYGYQLGTILMLRADTLAVAAVLESEEVGIYSIARAAADLLIFIPAVFNPVVLANASREGTIHRKYFAGLSFAMVVGALGLIVLARPAVLIVGGAEFLEAVTPLRLLAIGTVGLGIGTTGIHYLLGLGQRRRPAVIGLAGGGLTLALSVVSVQFGLGLAALGPAAAYWVLWLLVFLTVAQVDGVRVWHYVLPERRAAKTPVD